MELFRIDNTFDFNHSSREAREESGYCNSSSLCFQVRPGFQDVLKNGAVQQGHLPAPFVKAVGMPKFAKMCPWTWMIIAAHQIDDIWTPHARNLLRSGGCMMPMWPASTPILQAFCVEPGTCTLAGRLG
ncbi:uncharacterized protein LOC144130169 [Amblyomma americanum]